MLTWPFLCIFSSFVFAAAAEKRTPVLCSFVYEVLRRLNHMRCSIMLLKTVISTCAIVVLVSANEQEIAGKVRYFPTPTDPTGYIRPGLPLPLPRTWQHSDTVYEVRGDGFVFNATGNNCDDLEAAFDRYYKMIFDTPNSNEVSGKSSHSWLLMMLFPFALSMNAQRHWKWVILYLFII